MTRPTPILRLTESDLYLVRVALDDRIDHLAEIVLDCFANETRDGQSERDLVLSVDLRDKVADLITAADYQPHDHRPTRKDNR